MRIAFEVDPYPGKTRILFVGHPLSTHVHSWIDLLSLAEINVRFFAVPAYTPPADWATRVYLTSTSPPPGLNPETRKCLHPTPEQQEGKAATACPGRPVSPGKWLAKIITYWHPHIVHVFGIDDVAFFFSEAVRSLKFRSHFGTWLIQTRGGSDLTLTRKDPKLASRISNVLDECDQIITDNRKNFDYLQELGVSQDKIARIAPVPGTGGIDIDAFSEARKLPPSKRERVILWPKAYECPWSKALPVFEALDIAWEHIRPCKVYMLAAEPDVRQWFHGMRKEIREACEIRERIPRDGALELMSRARVMLAPSLVDGIPNSMYEAMACGAFPVVSPLDTISTVVEDEKNVLFTRNLYPGEIAEALVRAMSDDRLVDRAASNNVEVLKTYADRSEIRHRVVGYYEDQARGTCPKGTEEKLPLVSIVTPAFNQAPFLAETIQSILSQDYPNLEHIVLDDGSTDDTREVLAQYGDLICWESHGKMGEARTINEGFKRAKGDIVCVVRANSPLLQGAVSAVVSVMKQRPDLAAVYSDYYRLSEDSTLTEQVKAGECDLVSMFVRLRGIPAPASFMRTDATRSVGGVDPGLKFLVDLDLSLKLALYGPFSRIPEPFATLRDCQVPESGKTIGKETAKEGIRIVKRFFSLRPLPPEIRRMRRNALSLAHLQASRLSSEAAVSRIIHYVRYILYCPGNIARDGRNVRSALAYLFKDRLLDTPGRLTRAIGRILMGDR